MGDWFKSHGGRQTSFMQSRYAIIGFAEHRLFAHDLLCEQLDVSARPPAWEVWMYTSRLPRITMGFTPPEVTARVVVMIERMRLLSKRDPDLARLLAELSPYLPNEIRQDIAEPRPLFSPLPKR